MVTNTIIDAYLEYITFYKGDDTPTEKNQVELRDALMKSIVFINVNLQTYRTDDFSADYWFCVFEYAWASSNDRSFRGDDKAVYTQPQRYAMDLMRTLGLRQY